MKLEFRDLRADEIECRVQSIIVTQSTTGVVLLLYKDARCDMNILDETVGAMNWQRSHCRENANCIVSIWDEGKKQWISKEDTGTESNTEAQKGLASDSFKRACFNWGIGRELYTAPFLWIAGDLCNIKENKSGKLVCNDKFVVTDIAIENKKIKGITIANEKTKAIVFDTIKKKAKELQKPIEQKQPEQLACEKCGTAFKDTTYKGKVITAEQQYMSAIQKRGGAYCKKCYEAMKANES